MPCGLSQPFSIPCTLVRSIFFVKICPFTFLVKPLKRIICFKKSQFLFFQGEEGGGEEDVMEYVRTFYQLHIDITIKV